MLLKFHLPKWQNITYATICSYLQCSHNESWQAPVILSASCPFTAQQDCCTHKLKQTHSCCIISLWSFPGISILFANISEHSVCSLFLLTPPMKMKQTECTKTLAYKIQTPGNHPKERIWHSKHGEKLKARNTVSFLSSLPICTSQ
jgi:hypothetical protein